MCLLDEEPLLLVYGLHLQTGNLDWTTKRLHNLPVWLNHFLFKNNKKQVGLWVRNILSVYDRYFYYSLDLPKREPLAGALA